MVEKIDPSTEIKSLEEKRQALEKAVRIALNIEQLHKSLEATLLMGQPSADIPADALTTFEKLSSSTQGMSVDKLKESLAALERVVKTKLDQILHIAGLDEKALAAADTKRLETLLSNYRKQAQTAVALRVLLHSRGHPTDATELHVPTTQIRAKLSQVQQKERAYRKVIKGEIMSMMKETERMLTEPGISETMRRFLTASNADLQANLDHLDSGKSITSMPVAIEMIEMSEHEITSLDTNPALSSAEPAKEPSLQKQTLFTPRTTQQTPKPAPAPKKMGFFRRLWHWLTTPDSVTWRQTGRQEKQDRKG